MRRPVCALMPKVLTGLNFVCGRPIDGTHLWGCGILREEAGTMIHHLATRIQAMNFAQFQRRIERLGATILPELSKLPRIHPCILESNDDGHAANKLRLDGAEVHIFARHRCE